MSRPWRTFESILWRFYYMLFCLICICELFRARVDRPDSDHTRVSKSIIKLKLKTNNFNNLNDITYLEFETVFPSNID